MPAALQVVMGKGGVGKTTVSLALALARAHAGERVGFVSLASAPELELAVRTSWGGHPATLRVVALDPRRILDEVVGRLLPMPLVAGLLSSHPAYEAVYRIAPGVKELAVLHRLLELADEGLDRIVVDGLATGHGTHFLEAPRKSARMLVGVLADRARAIDAALTDPRRTSVLLVSTPEEMPVRETVQLAAALRAGGFAIEGLVANRAPERIFAGPGALEALARLQDRPTAAAVGSELGVAWPTVRRYARASAHVERQARDAEPHLAALQGLGLPLVRVPLLPIEEGRLRFVAAKLREGLR